MKKFTIMWLCLIITLVFSVTKVHADGSVLVPFIGDATTATVTSTGSLVLPNISIKVGDTISVTAMSCPASAVSLSGTNLTFSKSDCTAITSVIWGSSDPAVATVTEGNITILKTGKTEITGTATGFEPFKLSISLEDSSSGNTGSNTNNNNNNNNTNTNTNTNNTSTNNNSNNTNNSNQTIENDEPDGSSANKTVEKKEAEEVLVGKQTKINPATGIKEVLAIIVPISLIAGSVLFLKRRMA